MNIGGYMKDLIVKRIKDSIEVKEKILLNKKLLESIEKSAFLLIDAIKKGNKVIFCGNGGSAADAQHLSAELLGKFYIDRKALPSISLTVNSSVLTAVGNDFSYEKVFIRQLEGIGNKGDILVGISTSGNSRNIIEAFKYAQTNEIITIALTGESGGKLKDYADILINVPSNDTPRIQESHITIGHIICEIVEKVVFEKAGSQ